MDLGLEAGFTAQSAQVIIDQYKEIYPELNNNSAFVLEQLKLEEERFTRTLRQGEKEFEKIINNVNQTRALLESILSADDIVACANENAQTKKLRPSPDMMPPYQYER